MFQIQPETSLWNVLVEQGTLVRSLIGYYFAADDGVTDATVAVQAAVDWAKANAGYIDVPPPRVAYKTTDEINCWLSTDGNPRPWGFIAPFFRAGLFKCHFNGYDKAVFKWRNGDLRSAGCTFAGIRVEYDSTDSLRNPVGFDAHGVGNFRTYSCSVGPSNNTQGCFTTIFNGDGDDFVCFGGGRTFLYQATDGITFSITASGSTLTSSAPHFKIGNVGKSILLYNNTASRSEFLVIAGFNNDQSVSVVTPAQNTYTACPGVWDHAVGTVSGGSNEVFTTDCNCFSSTDSDLTIYIQGAGASGYLHRAKITYVAPNQVSLDPPAVTVVTGQPFTVPAVAFDDDTSLTTLGITNDFHLTKLHVEDFDGVGVLQSGQTLLNLAMMKSHAVPSPTDASSSLSCLWISRSDGYLDGDIEGRPVSSKGKMYFAALAGLLKIGQLDVVVSNAGILCYTESMGADGLVTIEAINIRNTLNAASISTLFRNEDNSDPRIDVRGPVLSKGLTVPTILPSAPGGIFVGQNDKGACVPVLKGSTIAGAFTYTAQLAEWTRSGAECFVEGRIVISAIGTPPTGNVQISLSDLPFTAENVAILPPVDLGRTKFLLSSGTWLSAHIINNTKTIALFECGSNFSPINLAAATGIVATTEIEFSVRFKIKLT